MNVLGIIDKRTKSGELSTICKAHEYVKEYVSNGYQQAVAYQKVMNCSYENSIAHASRYHNSGDTQLAFQEIISDNINEYFKHRDGITLKAQELYDQAEDTNTRLKVLEFIARIAGWLQRDNTINIDNRSVNIHSKLNKEDELAIVKRIKDLEPREK